MKPKIVRLTAQPWEVASGAQSTLRWAGGGHLSPYRFGGVGYRAGILEAPKFRVAIDFDETGWSGHAIPTFGALKFSPSLASYLDSIAGHYWAEAPITVEIGDEEAGGAEPTAWTTLLTGTVAEFASEEGVATLTITNLSAQFQKPLLTGRFAGTGGIEGPTEAANRIKRRSWGRVFNVEGRILDKANSIYEFGDPAQMLHSIVLVRDKGREASPAPQVLAWQGSIAATFAALQASVPVQGSGVVAPSIACVKWWTTPAGPLTADLLGEVGGSYDERAGTVAARIVQAGGLAEPLAAERDALNAARPDPIGLHVGDDSMTLAQALDRLLLGVSYTWTLGTDSQLRFRQFTFANPVETIISDSVVRESVLPPVKTRRLGYKRNERQHNDGEIAADILAAEISGLGDLATADEVTLGINVKNTGPGPMLPTGADLITTQGISAGITGQGFFATQGAVTLGMTGGIYRLLDEAGVAGLTNFGVITSQGISSGIQGQGALATRGFVSFGSSYLATEGGAIATESAYQTILGISSGITGQGFFATRGAVSLGTTGGIYRLLDESGIVGLTNFGVITTQGISAGFSGQAAIATDHDAVARILAMRGDNIVRNGAFTEGPTKFSLGSNAAYVSEGAGAPAPYAIRFANGGHNDNSYFYINDSSSVPYTAREVFVSFAYACNVATQIGVVIVGSDAAGNALSPVGVAYINVPASGSYTRSPPIRITLPIGTAKIHSYIQRTGADASVYITAIRYAPTAIGADETALQAIVSQLSATTGRALDGRLLNTSNNYGLRSLADAPPITDTDNSGSVTINIPSVVLYSDWGASITLPSGGVPGCAYNTLYYIYRNQPDPTTAGTSWGVTTDLLVALGVGKNFIIGYRTRAAAGAPLPPPPPPPNEWECVWADAWVETLERGFILARDVVAGDFIRILADDLETTTWGIVEENSVAPQGAGYRLRSESGVELDVSLRCPLTLRDGSLLWVEDYNGEELPVLIGDELRWEPCVLERKNAHEIAHIVAHQRTYAAGNVAGRAILTHNPLQYEFQHKR